MIAECFAVVEPLLGTKTACAAVGCSRATHYRRARPGRVTERRPRPAPANKLTGAGRGFLSVTRPGRARR